MLFFAKRRPDDIRTQADSARDRFDYLQAAVLYDEALQQTPDDAALHIQCGHMWKETGRFAEAGRHYEAAFALAPDDADLSLQMGHFYKVSGELAKAEAAYRRALALRPDWLEPAVEIAGLFRSGWRGSAAAAAAAGPEPQLTLGRGGKPNVFDAGVLSGLPGGGGLAPELVAARPEQLQHAHDERVDIRRLGHRERSRWGNLRTLRGIEAVRGFVVAAVQVTEMRLLLNGMLVLAAPLRGPYLLKYELHPEKWKKYVFNEWLDVSVLADGLYHAEITFHDATGGVRRFNEDVVIDRPLREADFPYTDALVEVTGRKPGVTLADAINARPSMVRSAHRSLFATAPRTILVQRTDQLGDVVCSIPALRRLRAIFPAAKLVGLLTASNADFARTLHLFDEIITIDFPDDVVNRRRIMALADQDRLRQRLAPYKFDLAIDLAESGVSRPLLLLSGAPVLYGFRDREFNYLTAGYEGNSHDRLNDMEFVPHASKVLSMIERLGAMARTNATVIRRDDLSPDLLAPYGLAASEKYVVLHTGARIEYSRWPHYAALAQLIIDRTGHRVLMMTNEPEFRASIPPALAASPRFILLDTLLPFDDFDALIAFAWGFVGNDSGPKHLASVRGVPTISIHMARNNWAEWGQDNGLILSRKVPCAGCALFYDAEECGKDFACIVNIRPAEVLAALETLWANEPLAPRHAASPQFSQPPAPAHVDPEGPGGLSGGGTHP